MPDLGEPVRDAVAELVRAALSDGHSLRDVAELLGVSHTMVAKAIAGV